MKAIFAKRECRADAGLNLTGVALCMGFAAATVLPVRALAAGGAESQPYFKILTPDTGAVLEVGSIYRITWTDSNVADADLEYTTNDGVTWERITWNSSISPEDETWRDYPWEVPDEPSGQCKVRIHEYYYDSDEVFDSGIFEIRAASSIGYGRLSVSTHGSTRLHFDPRSRIITIRSDRGLAGASAPRLYSLSGTSVAALPHATGSAHGVRSWKVPALAHGAYLLDWNNGSVQLRGRLTFK